MQENSIKAKNDFRGSQIRTFQKKSFTQRSNKFSKFHPKKTKSNQVQLTKDAQFPNFKKTLDPHKIDRNYEPDKKAPFTQNGL